MGWMIAIVALSLVMAALTFAELRRPVATSAVQLPELAVADRVITVFMLGSFTLAIVNGLILVASKALQ
jgi:hypothetical protein